MKLLLYSWGANNEKILEENLRRLGFAVVVYARPCRHFTRDMELAAEMIPLIHRESVEGVISFNYVPMISMICDTCRIPYYAWVYDCPHHTLYARHVMLPCNHIGIFDRDMVRRLRKIGVQTVYHVPLAVDAPYFGEVLRAADREREKRQCDLSFVGSLYTDEHNYYDRLPEERRAGAAAAIDRQCFRYDRDVLEEAIRAGSVPLDGIRSWMEENGLTLGEDYLASGDEVIKADILEKKVTVEERRKLLCAVAERFGARYRFDLYTASDLRECPSLTDCARGVVDYHTQMPLVFAGSRINLNISLRSIHSGIPLRVLDIMACGGFVLTNRQPEIDEYFAEDREYVCYDSERECLDKIAYYLCHEDERVRIAAAGQQAVRERFGYRQGLMKLFGIQEDGEQGKTAEL